MPNMARYYIFQLIHVGKVKIDVRLLADLQIKSNLHETLFCLEMHWKPKGT